MDGYCSMMTSWCQAEKDLNHNMSCYITVQPMPSLPNTRDTFSFFTLTLALHITLKVLVKNHTLSKNMLN